MLARDLNRTDPTKFSENVRNFRASETADGLVDQIAEELSVYLSPKSIVRLSKMTQDHNGNVSNIKRTVEYLSDLLSAYQYDNKETAKFINDNCRLLMTSCDYINKILAILHRFNLDEEVFFGPFYSFMTNAFSSDELYAYLCLMQEKDEKVELIDVLNLNRDMDKSYKEKLLQIYPLTPKAMGTMYYMYNQYLKNKKRDLKKCQIIIKNTWLAYNKLLY